MDFREKLEQALTPLVTQLKEKLASLPTLVVLNHYQMRIHAVQVDKHDAPDGFFSKWRYLWALHLSNPFSKQPLEGDEENLFDTIDNLVERIFEVYRIGAMLEPGRSRGSEEEFLTRLGLAIKVREPDVLGYPEQIRSWALARLQPFDNTYFLPSFGSRLSEIMEWLDALIGVSGSRLNAWLSDLGSILSDVKPVQAQFAQGDIDIQVARKRAAELKIADRLERNSRQSEQIHIFSHDQVRVGLAVEAAEKLTKHFGIRPGEVIAQYVFPHDENPLESKMFVVLPDKALYFLDPASAYRVVARTFEREILANHHLRDRYLRNRDRETERLVTDDLKKVFPDGAIHRNYFLEKGSYEKDLFLQDGKTVILVECKNSRIRAFKGASADLLNFQRDFRHSIQFGYEQASEVKQRILASQQVTFCDDKGNPSFSVKRDEVGKIYIVCVTLTPRGPFGTDLSYELKKPDHEPFPLALNLFDFDTICKHLNQPGQFVAYLQARERLHGRVRTGDELNFAGYFLKNGNLDFEDGTSVADDFSGIFDRRWYREKGVEVEEPTNPPVLTSITRKGSRVTIEDGTGRRQVFVVPSWMIQRATGRPPIRMKGSDRNKPCPCGSGRKLKNCCGVP